jgi:hypothetical protein
MCAFYVLKIGRAGYPPLGDNLSVADPDPVSGVFLNPGSGREKNPDPGSGTRNEHPGTYF